MGRTEAVRLLLSTTEVKVEEPNVSKAFVEFTTLQECPLSVGLSDRYLRSRKASFP